jgi:hypothetical protein
VQKRCQELWRLFAAELVRGRAGAENNFPKTVRAYRNEERRCDAIGPADARADRDHPTAHGGFSSP